MERYCQDRKRKMQNFVYDVNLSSLRRTEALGAAIVKVDVVGGEANSHPLLPKPRWKGHWKVRSS